VTILEYFPPFARSFNALLFIVGGDQMYVDHILINGRRSFSLQESNELPEIRPA
jgi:hypothetical protein